MASMVIRNIPEDVFERFKKRAKAEGKSAEQLGREIVEKLAKPTRDQLIAEIDAIRSASKRISGAELIEDIRRGRDLGLNEV